MHSLANFGRLKYIFFFRFFVILPKPENKEKDALSVLNNVNAEEVKNPMKAFTKKLHQIPRLLKYIIPFGLVYFLEYFINQGTVC